MRLLEGQTVTRNLSTLQNRLGYYFNNINFLKQALIRQSAIEESRQLHNEKSFQRLEFVGDKV